MSKIVLCWSRKDFLDSMKKTCEFAASDRKTALFSVFDGHGGSEVRAGSKLSGQSVKLLVAVICLSTKIH